MTLTPFCRLLATKSCEALQIACELRAWRYIDERSANLTMPAVTSRGLGWVGRGGFRVFRDGLGWMGRVAWVEGAACSKVSNHVPRVGGRGFRIWLGF